MDNKRKLKTGEFEILKFLEGEQIIHVIRFHLYPVSKSGRSKDSGRIDDYYEPMGFTTYEGMKLAREKFEIENNINGFKLKTEYETMTLKEFNKLKKNVKSYNYFIPTNENNPKFRKRFKIANSQKIIEEREERKQIFVSPIKSKTNIQICIKDDKNTFQDKEIGKINKFQLITGNPSSRDPKKKGNGIDEKYYEEYKDIEIIEGIKEIASPKSWTREIGFNFLETSKNGIEKAISILKLGEENNLENAEKFIFREIVLPFALTTKIETNAFEPIPSEVDFHQILNMVFSEPKTYLSKEGRKVINGIKEFYEMKKKFEEKEKFTFKELINNYREEFKKECNKRRITKKQAIKIIRSAIKFKN